MNPLTPEAKPFKLSWSVMSAWARGDREQALASLRGETIPMTAPMLEGQRLHGIIAQNELLLLPMMDSSYRFEGVHANHRLSPNYYQTLVAPGLIVSGIMDVISEKHRMIIDWKASEGTGQDKRQLELYGAMLDWEGIKMEVGILARVKAAPAPELVELINYDRIKLTEERKEAAVAWALKIAAEIREVLDV